jgi:lipoate-protein ligase B
VRRAITFHGLALNVNTDLACFDRIIPCGLDWAEVTSVAQELGAAQRMERVRDSFLRHFAKVFGYSAVEKSAVPFDLYAERRDRSAAAGFTTTGTF